MPPPGETVMPTIEFPREIELAFAEHRKRTKEVAGAIASEYGSAAVYRASLQLQMIDAPDDPLLPAFYDLYAQIFTLADEREPLDGFASVLAFNENAAVQRDYGPFREPILIARDPRSGELIAAVNFTLYAYPRSIYAFDASCQMHFLMVREDIRGLGSAAI